ncbi:MAG: cysteine--tRNA ligase [Clostridia bacterium]
MPLKIYNVLSRKKEVFIPQEEGKVKMYACGITASGNAHIGHAFQAIVFDVICKYLVYKGYSVTYVRNYTDVDDKIISKARELNEDPKAYTERLIKKIDNELAVLSINKPTIQSKVSECIQDIICFIEKLIKTGHAYCTDEGNVYFSVKSYPKYGHFSNRIIDESLIAVRKELEKDKLDEKDFALWKTANDDEIFWESPWGRGRPGWHIECSAMSMKYLGNTLDIHGGGKDLIFPHHENEIAQSESLTGKIFSNYWIHNGLIKVNGQKMSKSLNNGIDLEDLLKQYHPDVIRLTLLQNNYRTDCNLIDGMFDQNEKRIYSFYKILLQINELKCSDNSEYDKSVLVSFENVMDNDLNTALALADLLSSFNKMAALLKSGDSDSIKKVSMMGRSVKKICEVLGILQGDPFKSIAEIKNKIMTNNSISESEISALIKKRNEFKANSDYDVADKIRQELKDKGIILQDTKGETKWDID